MLKSSIAPTWPRIIVGALATWLAPGFAGLIPAEVLIARSRGRHWQLTVGGYPQDIVEGVGRVIETQPGEVWKKLAEHPNAVIIPNGKP